MESITDFIGGGYKKMLGKLTREEVLAGLKRAQERQKANPNCPHCEGTGTIWEANGNDEIDPVPCNCIKY